MDDIFEKLNRIEAKLDEINKLLGVGKGMGDRDKINESSNQTVTYDVNVKYNTK